MINNINLIIIDQINLIILLNNKSIMITNNYNYNVYKVNCKCITNWKYIHQFIVCKIDNYLINIVNKIVEVFLYPI